MPASLVSRTRSQATSRISQQRTNCPRKIMAPTLGAFLDEYFDTLNVKASTATMYGHTRRCLIEFFGADKLLRDIEPADADKFCLWLRTNSKHAGELADATINKRIGMARQFLAKAAKWKRITENPFGDAKAGGTANKARQFMVTRTMADKLIDACPDAQWRLLVALSRYGGLRCPSEHLALTWADIDFDKNRIRVPSPKTEHHEGKGSRLIPLFP
jgi:integrase